MQALKSAFKNAHTARFWNGDRPALGLAISASTGMAARAPSMSSLARYYLISLAIHLAAGEALFLWGGVRNPIVHSSSFQGNPDSMTLVLMGHPLPSSGSSFQEEVQKPAEEKLAHNAPVSMPEPVPIPKEPALSHSIAKMEEETPNSVAVKPSRLESGVLATTPAASIHELPKPSSLVAAQAVQQSIDSIAKAPGRSGLDARSVSTKDIDFYLASIRERIESCKEYPALARRMHEEGEVVFRISIDREGELKSIEGLSLHSSSVLTAAGRRAIEKAAPFGKPPAGWPVESSLRIPIRFSLYSSRQSR